MRSLGFNDDLQPWEQRADESPKQYEGFRCYLDLGEDRTVVKAWVQYSALLERKRIASGQTVRARDRQGTKKVKPLDYFYGWASRFEWRERALEWDRYVERQAQKARIKKIEQMRERHQQQCEFTLGLLLRPAKALAKKYDRNPAMYEQMEDKELMRQFAIMTRRVPGIMNMERAALIGGNGQAPNTFDEAKDAGANDPFVLIVPPSTDTRPPCDPEDDSDADSEPDE